MNSPSIYDELDAGVTALLADPQAAAPPSDERELGELLGLAADLRYLPRRSFKLRLKADLLEKLPELEHVVSPNGHARRLALAAEPPAPAFRGLEHGSLPVRRVNLAASLLLHGVALALVATSGLWMAQHRYVPVEYVSAVVLESSEYALPPAPAAAGGGGGGGARDKLEASKGAPPRLAREQITPPAVVMSPPPRLAMEPAVVGPPEIKFRRDAMGDPMRSLTAAPSAGSGSGGGIGSGSGGGVGVGTGPGVGPGLGGGLGGGVYRVGGGVSTPRLIHSPDPEYSDEARKARHQGTVVLWAVIGPDGVPRDLRVQRSLGYGLDEKALEAVRAWRFEPAMKGDQPVAVQVGIEVNFRLY